jgi:hypothetical protein
MPKLTEVCRHVRSKNAGPFWITVDLFFNSAENFHRYKDAPVLGPDLFARLYGTDASLVKRLPFESLRVVKISFPRPQPQGWMGERDMHAGQQYVRLLDIELG